jgi:hypothetical protein
MIDERTPLPALGTAELTSEALLEVVSDIELLSEVLLVQCKFGRAQQIDPAAQPGFRDAISQLLSGAVVGLQVRYRHAGHEYWDTIMRTGSGYRIVRIDHTQAVS